MKKFIFYCLAATSFLLSSCTKDDILGGMTFGPGSNLHFYYSLFDSVAIAYINLKPTSNYIYKDQGTGLTDTVIVTKSYKRVENFSYESYDLTCSIIPFNLPTITWLQASANCDVNNGPTPVIYDADFELINWQTQLPAFWYPFTSSLNKQYTYIPSIIIEGTAYYGVNKFYATNGFQPSESNYQENAFYWVKGIGIIKKEIKTFNSVKTSLLVKYW